MAEKTLNDPLSGAEIKQIILQEIERRLNGDCTLGNDLAYAGFTAKFEIKVSFLRSLVKETLIWGGKTDIPASNDPVEAVGDTVIAETYTSSPPNVARQEHDLPIPVLVQTPTGPMRQKVPIEQVKRGPGRPPKVQQP